MWFLQNVMPQDQIFLVCFSGFVFRPRAIFLAEIAQESAGLPKLFDRALQH